VFTYNLVGEFTDAFVFTYNLVGEFKKCCFIAFSTVSFKHIVCSNDEIRNKDYSILITANYYLADRHTGKYIYIYIFLYIRIVLRRNMFSC
jgi:hypothetical protein